MSDHVRKQIRDHVRTRLEGLESLGLQVTTHEGRSLEDLMLPSADVSTPSESSSRANKSGTMMREVQVFVDLLIAGDPSGLWDELDFFAVQIDNDLDDNPPSIVQRMELLETSQELLSDEDGDQWYGFMSLEFQATLFTPKGDATSVVH